MNPLLLRRSPSRFVVRRKRAGFTLVEMLTVMGIVVVLLALVVPAVRSLGSNKLNNSGRLFSNLLTAARSEAINRGTLMQVRVVTNAWAANGGDDVTMHYRKFSLWQHKPPAAAGAATDPDPYTQVSTWETLPEGIVFETNPTPGNDTDYSFNSATPGPGTYFLDPNFLSSASGSSRTGVAAGGGATMNAVCIEFTPTGALNLTGVSALYFLLVPGVLPKGGTAVTYTNAHHPNWLMVQVTPLTGRIQIVRP